MNFSYVLYKLGCFFLLKLSLHLWCNVASSDDQTVVFVKTSELENYVVY